MAAKKKKATSKSVKPRAPGKAGTSKASTAQRRSDWIEAMIQNGGNATLAAVIAGYSPGRAAEQAGWRLSKDVEVARRLAERRAQVLAEAEKATGINAKETLLELRGMVFSDIADAFSEKDALLPVRKMPVAFRRAVAKIKVVEMQGGMAVDAGNGQVEHVPMYTKEITMYDKNSAIDKALKVLGLYEADNRQQPPASTIVHMPGVKTVQFKPLSGHRSIKE